MSRAAAPGVHRSRKALRCVLAVTLLGCFVPVLEASGSEREVSFTVVYDNNAIRGGLQADWGFACHVAGKGLNVLFDTGTRPEIFWANLEKLTLRPESVDLVVLSHDHQDHTGGLWSFLERHSDVTVVAPGSFSPGFFERVRAFGARGQPTHARTALGDGLWVTGPLGKAIVEQSLVVDTPRGLVVVTGCSHPGIVEIVRKVREDFSEPIHLVFGGFHLLRASRDEVRGVIRDLKQLGVERVGPAHCTGNAAMRQFREGFGSGFVEMGVGRVIRIEQPAAEPRRP